MYSTAHPTLYRGELTGPEEGIRGNLVPKLHVIGDHVRLIAE